MEHEKVSPSWSTQMSPFPRQARLESIGKSLRVDPGSTSSLCPLIPPDLPMQQNMALFEFNGQSGYLLKHEFMRRLDKQFNPFSVDRIDVVVATTLSITARPRADQRLGGLGSGEGKPRSPPLCPNPLP